MRLRIFLLFSGQNWVPIHYNYWLQSLLYRSMEKEMGDRVHNLGFDGAGRIFRYFTFSRLMGQYELSPDRSHIRFPEGCQWVVSSPLDDLLGAMATGILQAGRIDIGPIKAEVTEIQVEKLSGMLRNSLGDELGNLQEFTKIRVRTLSSIVAYSTLYKGDGRKYTVYFQPGEPEFERIVSENLLKKDAGLKRLTSLNNPQGNQEDGQTQQNKECDQSSGGLRLRMLGHPRLNIIEYKGGIIKGYSGSLELYGTRNLLQLALEAGLGSKNAQGFGCLEVI